MIGTGSYLPSSVIAKCAVATYGPYEPDKPIPDNAAYDFFADWAALELLNAEPNDPPLAPRLYGGDRVHGVTVVEDLGDGEHPNTLDALHADDEDLARDMLIENVTLLATLHATTMPRVAEYRHIRDRLGPRPAPRPLFRDPWSEPTPDGVSAAEIDDAVYDYQETLGDIGVRAQTSVGDEIERVALAVEDSPGPLLALCKGDQNMANDYLRLRGQPRLFDYGSCGLRHAFVEGMPGRMTWGCTMRIPRELLAPMDDAYRARLAVALPQLREEAVYRRTMIEAAGRWHVLHVLHRLPEALVNDRPRGPTSLRQQVAAWILAFAELSDELGELPALGGSARALYERLCQLWPADIVHLPYYPVFRR